MIRDDRGLRLGALGDEVAGAATSALLPLGAGLLVYLLLARGLRVKGKAPAIAGLGVGGLLFAGRASAATLPEGGSQAAPGTPQAPSVGTQAKDAMVKTGVGLAAAATAKLVTGGATALLGGGGAAAAGGGAAAAAAGGGGAVATGGTAAAATATGGGATTAAPAAAALLPAAGVVAGAAVLVYVASQMDKWFPDWWGDTPYRRARMAELVTAYDAARGPGAFDLGWQRAIGSFARPGDDLGTPWGIAAAQERQKRAKVEFVVDAYRVALAAYGPDWYGKRAQAVVTEADTRGITSPNLPDGFY